MASITGAENALEARLAELEAFGLGRPANVLFTEYVAVLVSRGVIDAVTAEQISRAFHAAHYSALNPDDPGFRETIKRLEEVTARLAGMPPEERLELSGSVQADLRVLSGNASRLAAGNASSMAEHRPGALVGVTETFSDPDSTPWDQDLDSLESLPQIALGPVTPRRRRGALRVAAMIPAALGLVFAGYASHDRINQILESRGVAIESHHAQRPGAGKPDFDNVVHMRARLEADRKHDQKAKLAYELYLQYRPDDAEALNNLGWLYLTTDDRAVHDPQRGLELGLRAIELDRKGTYLDTAAEGQFQAGNPEAAVKLEVEAIAAEGRPATAWFQQGSPVPIYRRQLAKFRRAVALKHGERAVAPEGVPYPIGSATGLPDPPPPSLPDM